MNKVMAWLDDYADMLQTVAHMNGKGPAQVLYQRSRDVKRFIAENRAGDTVTIPDELLTALVQELEFARKFITSWQKMHPTGVALYDQLIERGRSWQPKPRPEAPPPDDGVDCAECAQAQEHAQEPSDTAPMKSHFDIFLSVYQLAREIVRLTETVPTECGSPDDFVRRATRGG